MPTRETPILMSAPMVRAIIAGTKTQTRRVVKNQGGLITRAGHFIYLDHKRGPEWEPYGGSGRRPVPNDVLATYCPYGVPGDQLWVREAWALVPYTSYWEPDSIRHGSDISIYKASWVRSDNGIRWLPSIHMPRWASRLLLEITEVRVQRLQEISEEDAKAEGVTSSPGYDPVKNGPHADPHRKGFMHLWDSIHAKPQYVKGAGFGGAAKRVESNQKWSDNPWVWAITFRRAG